MALGEVDPEVREVIEERENERSLAIRSPPLEPDNPDRAPTADRGISSAGRGSGPRGW